jgi:hypothetical protein
MVRFACSILPCATSIQTFSKTTGELAEELMYCLEPARQQSVHPVFHRTLISHVVDVNCVSQLTDSLDAAFPLFEPSWVPRKVEVYESAEALEI